MLENPLRIRIKQRLKDTRKRSTEASVHIGMARGYISNFLTGKSGKFRDDLIPKLAEYLDCDPRYLMGTIADPAGAREVPVPVSMLAELRLALLDVGRDLEAEILAKHGGMEPERREERRRFARDLEPARNAVRLAVELESFLSPGTRKTAKAGTKKASAGAS